MNEPTSPTSLLYLNPSSSQQIEFFASSIVNEVKSGNESPLRVLIQLRAMEKASKQILDGIKENILTEAEKYPGKDFEMWGNKLSKEDVYTSYDYTVCGDVEWEQLDVATKLAVEKQKDREKFLRSLKEPLTLLNKDTAEVYEVRPPLKKSIAGVKVSIR